jgi:hypothetical protein
MNSHNDTEVNKTEEEVREFLRASYEFKMMKNIASKPGMNNAANFIASIENSLTFHNILNQTQELDFDLTDNIMAYNLGRNKMNALLYCVGFFSSGANFNYYILHFRESVKAHLENRQEVQEKPRK